MRERLLPHALFWTILWPAAAAISAAMDADERVLYPFWKALGLSGLGLLVLLPQLLVACVVLTAATACLFGLPSSRPAPLRLRLFEPLVFGVAVVAAAALRFPALLHHAFLLPLRPLPTWVALVLLSGFALALIVARAVEEPGGVRRGALVLAPAGLALGLGFHGGATGRPPAEGPRDSVLLIGVDSVSAADVPGGPLEALAAEGGRAYRAAVSPALLTNAVWATILLGEPPERHGVLIGLQDWSLDGNAASLTARARAEGLSTVAVFPNRSTTWAGARGGFDADFGGALGWHQMSTAWLKNSGVLLPLLLPLLPDVPGARTPRNQVDTFCYDLDSDLARVLEPGEGRRFVAAHVTYLHESRYPSFPEMGPEERRRVLRAPAGRVFDDSFNWLHEDEPDAPIPLRRFKWDRLQRLLSEYLRSSGVLEPSRGNVVVVFADHGPRHGLKQETFCEPRFWHVPLLSWGDRSGLPVDAPLSLGDLDRIAGLARPGAPRVPPRVTFASVPPKDWAELMSRTRPRPDGSTELPGEVLARIAGRAESCDPAGTEGAFGGLPPEGPAPAASATGRP